MPNNFTQTNTEEEEGGESTRLTIHNMYEVVYIFFHMMKQKRLKCFKKSLVKGGENEKKWGQNGKK